MTAAAATGDAIAALSIKHPGLTDAEVADDVACVLAAAAPVIMAAGRERLKQVIGERFKTVLAWPANGYLVDAVPWSPLLDLLGPGAGLLTTPASPKETHDDRRP